jgi:RNA polymerase sigma-70 factor (ECF subfamily)
MPLNNSTKPVIVVDVDGTLADAARRYARGPAHEFVVGDLDVTFADEKTNLPYEGRGDRETLRAAIDALPAAQRDAIRLVKLGEMSLREAAGASGTTVGALKVATHRAMMALRKRLTNR